MSGGRGGKTIAVTGLSLGTALTASAAAEASDFKVTNLGDSGAGSLRQAVLDANAHAGADRILFKSGLSGTIALTSGELTLSGPTRVVGPGAKRLAVTGSGGDRILDINSTPPNPSEVRISGLTLRDTNAPLASGAAISNNSARLTISRSVLSGNTAGGSGGAIFSTDYSSPGGSLTINSSTLSGNRAAGPSPFNNAGAITAYHATTIESSTIAGNSAENHGGGILVAAISSLTLRNSTVAGNSAGGNGGGIYQPAPGSSRLVNSIVGDNSAPAGADLFGSFDASFSLIQNPAGATLTGSPNITGQDPRLKPLANNGGDTRTMALRRSSPALDKGRATGADQRGAPRPFNLKSKPKAVGGNNADIGAYERVLCGRIAVNRVGTAAPNKLVGTPGPDGILGLGGKDTLVGRGGRDGLCGGRGRDKLKGGPGRDRLLGGPGRDKLRGGPGRDRQTQ